jgi:hypothetical protein
MDRQTSKVVGIILSVVGVALLIWGYQMSGSFGNEVTKTLTGSSTDAVMYRYIGGAVSLAVGLFMFFKKSSGK